MQVYRDVLLRKPLTCEISTFSETCMLCENPFSREFLFNVRLKGDECLWHIMQRDDAQCKSLFVWSLRHETSTSIFFFDPFSRVKCNSKQKWLFKVAIGRDEELSGQFALAAVTDYTTINKVNFCGA